MYRNVCYCLKANCKTCPFREINGRMLDAKLAGEVTNRTLFKAHQICHGSEGPNREWRSRCKGSFDYNFEIYKRMGFEHLIK